MIQLKMEVVMAVMQPRENGNYNSLIWKSPKGDQENIENPISLFLFLIGDMLAKFSAFASYKSGHRCNLDLQVKRRTGKLGAMQI